VSNSNLYATLRDGFPDALDSTAIELADGFGESDTPLRYCWRDLERASAMIANLIDSLDLPPQSRVAVQVDKSVEALLLYLAVLRSGHVFLPLNSAYQAAEIEYFIGNAEPALVVCTPKAFGWLSKIAFKAGTAHVFTLGDDRRGSLLERAAQHADTHAVAKRSADDLAAILYTSGTTGRSKGAMLTHGNLASNAQVLNTFWGWRQGGKNGADEGRDTLIHALPIFHVHGLFVACHGALLAGARMLWFNRFDARAVVARLPEASVFMGVPTLYVRLLAEPGFGAEACRSMRLFISGSAPLLLETFEAFRAQSGHTILERYGMSETVMLTSNPYRPESARRGGTVGRPLPGVALRVVGDGHQSLPTGDVGQIEVRGPGVFKGYWRMPEKTAEDFHDGWFATGDVGRIEADGFVSIVGRSKDLVITGGYNVYPAEIEGFLNALPGVAESAVIGVPHADFGEAVVAVVVPRPGGPAPLPAELIAALKGRIAGFKVPKHVAVVAELPRNAMGKVQKNVLREQHRSLFAAPALVSPS
jgi:malonyl-CoA/methylmalonyl-CoA synthetase